MSGIDQELLTEFLQESHRIAEECESLLEGIEDDSFQAPRLAEFANKIDRIMGAAKSLAMLVGPKHPLHIIGDVTQLCKALGERGAKGAGQERLYAVTVAFLLDAVEITRQLLDAVENPDAADTSEIKSTIVDRVSWIAEIYRNLPKGLLDGETGDKLGQSEIDELMRKLGDG